MSDVEGKVAEHYKNEGLMQRILKGMRAIGVDPDNATSSDLKAGDEFHTGGVLATEHLFGQIDLAPDARILDVGCGIGGTSRYLAERYDAQVRGIDLTPAFVEVAVELSAMVGLSDKTHFQVGSAVDMPVEDNGFDLAVLLHVGMNISDKTALISEIARAVKPGGQFALFDVMTGSTDEPPVFPLPWSSEPETSFLAPPAAYEEAAKAAGLVQVHREDRSEFAVGFFRDAMAKAKVEGPPAFGINLMMGETAGEKLGNYFTNLETGRVAPVEMIFKKPA